MSIGIEVYLDIVKVITRNWKINILDILEVDLWHYVIILPKKLSL